MSPIYHNFASYFSCHPSFNCDPFVSSVTHFPAVTYFYNYKDSILQVWLIFLSVTFYSKWSIFPSMSQLSKCDPFLTSMYQFSDCDQFFSKFDPIFLNVTDYSKCDPVFQLLPVFPNVSHFSKCDPFFHRWPVFKCVEFL